VEYGAASAGQQTREEEDTAIAVEEEIWDTTADKRCRDSA
jgi:hypothetical protein